MYIRFYHVYIYMYAINWLINRATEKTDINASLLDSLQSLYLHSSFDMVSDRLLSELIYIY